MAWGQLEPTPPHLTYLLFSTFLISYVLFVRFCRNRLHLSEPPIALIVGVLLGPYVLGWITPNFCTHGDCKSEPDAGGWGWGDDVVQEMTRVIVGIQCFAVGVELPPFYAGRRWGSVAMLLGPVMATGWLLCALFVWAVFHTGWRTALVIAATLTPTDPVLAASILANSQFSTRIPRRLKHVLSAESGCNDGVAFPFLYIGLFLLTKGSVGEALKSWFLITILWQCVFGTLVGVLIGTAANRILRFSDRRGYTDAPGFTLFYLLLAVLCVGIGATLGVDDFLVAFGAGYGFARDGWFTRKIKAAHLPSIIDLLLNSAMFLYLGTVLPWASWTAGPAATTPGDDGDSDHALTSPDPVHAYVTPGRLLAFLALVLLFRRIPVVLALHRWVPAIHSLYEALFCGHFGPMGLGALFLALEARNQLGEEAESVLGSGRMVVGPRSDDVEGHRAQAIAILWPVVCFVVVGSTLVHGLSVLALSLISHFNRPKEQRAGIMAAETDPLLGMEQPGESSESEESEGEEEQDR